MSFNGNSLIRELGDEAETLENIQRMFESNTEEELLSRAAEVDLSEIGIKNFDN